jgi:aspartyl-tRNA synthetase
MYRTHNCGALSLKNVGEEVILSGWVDTIRDKGFLLWIDLRDRYGLTQLMLSEESSSGDLLAQARKCKREFVLRVYGKVIERSSKNPNIPTGEIEIEVNNIEVLNRSALPPFTIEDETDGGEELRMKYRYLDIRRNPVKDKLIFRSKLSLAVREYLNEQDFVEVETPFLIKSTPEGARDFVVPSRMNPGEFYALPQSPQTFKQLLMVAGMDRYFQIVKCFRDEDLRADRQPEFTQIDCEMSFVTRDEVLSTFEGMTRHLFNKTIGVDLPEFPVMSYDHAMRFYGSDKPDTRFDMTFTELDEHAKGKGFQVFDNAEAVLGICVKGVAEEYSNKDIKKLTEWVKRPQIGAKGLVYIRWHDNDSIKSSIGKFYEEEDLKNWIRFAGGDKGDMMLVLSGDLIETREQLGELRLEMGRRHGLMNPSEFKALWVVDFPLLEWDEENGRFHAMHHPFTSPKAEDRSKMESEDRKVLASIRADAYDLVINGLEIGGGSIRIHDRTLQEKNFELLGFSEEEARQQFGFLMGAFEYGAPPHGGIAYGFDRLCAVMMRQSSIRDFIAFPKNNQGRDIMINAPAAISEEQLEELYLEQREIPGEEQP